MRGQATDAGRPKECHASGGDGNLLAQQVGEAQIAGRRRAE